jgi:octopine/nopaline transport system permease protein
MDLAFLAETFLLLLKGLPLTLQLVTISVLIGASLAVVLALMRMSKIHALDKAAHVYVFFFRGTPLLVQIFLVYYGLAQFAVIRESILWPVLREPYWCAILALTLNTAAYGSEILRGGIQAVPWGQLEAGRACGMSGFLLFRRVVSPIMLRQALPAYGNEIILMVKGTSLTSIITLMEITGIATKLISETYRSLEVFICAGAIYLAVNFLIARGLRAVEYAISPHLRPAVGSNGAAPRRADLLQMDNR